MLDAFLLPLLCETLPYKKWSVDLKIHRKASNESKAHLRNQVDYVFI